MAVVDEMAVVTMAVVDEMDVSVSMAAELKEEKHSTYLLYQLVQCLTLLCIGKFSSEMVLVQIMKEQQRG